MREIWKKVPHIPEELEASNFGKVRTLARVIEFSRLGKTQKIKMPSRVLAPYISKNGYYVVAVKKDSIRKKFLVHRLIGFCFVKGFRAGLTINHINGSKLDNSPKNLEWITLEENTGKQWETGLVDLRGEKHPSSFLKEKDIKDIRLNLSGKSQAKLASDYGVSTSMIGHILARRRWAHIE